MARVDGNVSKVDADNVDSEILPRKEVLDIGCSVNIEQIEPRSFLGDVCFYDEQGKPVGGVAEMFSNNVGCTAAPTSITTDGVSQMNASSPDKASMEPVVVETASAHADRVNSPAEPTIFVIADSPAPPTAHAGATAPYVDVPEDFYVISTGDGDDSRTESDGGEQDLSSSAPALGKNP